ncbi:PASTA domain-containing protein [Ruminococcus flavefaciens]|uniref:PASTA domain-containing protein n=1 Tax=Ruminococcus flavefaciens TaxID=1265 RepID=A0A1K1PRI1_RUMFL|nr:PASTA domain-containing protein [Ruminococcus flavefaciens]SFW50053.1 PASTA domain-containing protein [Ruminococcus flavefaciens]
MNDKELGLDVFEMADDEEIKRIAADCPASPEEKERMFKLSQKIYNERTNESNEAHADEVSGVEQYKKPIWHKIVSAAAALALVAGLGTGGYFLARNKGADNHFASGEDSQVQEAAESNYPFGEIDRVRMISPAIAPAAIEFEPGQVSELTSWLDKLSWEEPENAEMPDGEYIMLYIYNNGDPYMLSVSLMDNSIRYYKSSNDEPKVYSGSEVISRFLNTIELEPDIYLYDIADISEDDTVSAVWKYVHMGSKDGFSVPDLYYKKADLAKQELRELGFEYKVVKIESTEVQPDYVVKTEPKAGTELRKGNTVTLYVSMGSEGENVTVDDYIGKMAEDASVMAGYKNFKVYTYEIPSNEPQGTVVEQYPKAGAKAVSGENLTLFTSKGGFTAGEITYKFVVPHDTGFVNGSSTVEFVFEGNGNTSNEMIGILDPGTAIICNLKGEGSGIKAIAYISELNTNKRAELGHYIFDFDNGTYTIEEEDIEGAFEAIK